MNIQYFLFRLALGGLLIAVVAFGAASDAMARHQWDDFHLQMPSDVDTGDPTGPAAVTVYFNNDAESNPLFATDSEMRAFLSSSIGDWNFEIGNDPASDWPGGDVTLASDVTGSGIGAGLCCSGQAFIDAFLDRMNATDGDLTPGGPSAVNSFNGGYGNSGWLGIAIVEDSASYTGDPAKGPHIIYGEIYLNDYYATDLVIFKDSDDITYVFCQELGHTLGLDHAKKDTGTCMFTGRGLDSFGSTSSPNLHDGEMINDIAHGASAHSGGGGGGGGGGKPDNGGGGPPDGGGGRPVSAGPMVGNPTVSAFWAETFETRDDMFASADLVVAANVLSGSAFDRNVGTAAAALPVSQVMLQIDQAYKGQSAPVITLEQSRGPGFEIEDDPGYVRDDNYLLYLRRIGINTYRVVNPAGRIRQ